MEANNKIQATQKVLKIKQPKLEVCFPAFVEFGNEQAYLC